VTYYVVVGRRGVDTGPPAGPPTHRSESHELGGRKSLYSTSYYDRDTFWSIYGGETYRELKARYDPNHRLLDLYDKCVGSS
jgi:hypothetical protein